MGFLENYDPSSTYKPLDVDFEIPEYLQEAIDNYIRCLNHEKASCYDCYITELDLCIRDAWEEGYYSDEQREILRDYYRWHGILKSGNSEVNRLDG